VIEDAVAGVEAGAAGAFGLVIGVDRGDHADALRTAGADLVINDLSEIRIGPDRRIHSQDAGQPAFGAGAEKGRSAACCQNGRRWFFSTMTAP
jgi:hypothetical protein